MARSPRPKRDWTSIREWANLAVAIGVLLVAIVSVWTTTQISGLEDYFRSEIARRNSDLNSLSDQARRVGSLADEREKRLAQLQTTTEQVTASNLAAQGKLLSTEQELSRLGFEVLNAKQSVANSRAQLALLAAQSGEQISLIDLFRRQRFFEQAAMRILFAGLRADQKGPLFTGEEAYRLITTWSAGEVSPDLASYLPEFRTNAQNTCEWIRSYNPILPKRQDFPNSPRMPGKPVDNGTSYRMTQREYDTWIAARDQFSRRLSEVIKTNDDALKVNVPARFRSRPAGT